MRDINKTFDLKKTVDVETVETAVKEILSVIYENKAREYVDVEVQYITESGQVISQENYAITDQKYELLMSESPGFAPGKPYGEYREVDLWYIIDQMRAEKQS